MNKKQQTILLKKKLAEYERSCVAIESSKKISRV